MITHPTMMMSRFNKEGDEKTHHRICHNYRTGDFGLVENNLIRKKGDKYP
jgi:hypothetical protein